MLVCRALGGQDAEGSWDTQSFPVGFVKTSGAIYLQLVLLENLVQAPEVFLYSVSSQTGEPVADHAGIGGGGAKVVSMTPPLTA